MFWLSALLALAFLVIISYYLLSGIAATTRDMELIRELGLSLQWVVHNSLAFNPSCWKRRPFGPRLITALLPPLQKDFRTICRQRRNPLCYLYWGAFCCFYVLVRIKGVLVSSPRDLRALIGLQILAVRQGQAGYSM